VSPATLQLPRADGTRYGYTLQGGTAYPPPAEPPSSRIAYAAAHVVANSLADNTPGSKAQLDWEATLAYRRHLWRYGFAVAEAMDTAQRGMGLDWEGAKELIRRSTAEAKTVGGRIACGAGTDHLQPDPSRGLDDIIRAYEEQCAFVESQGSRIILMASRALAASAKSPDDYAKVYDQILSQVREPVIIHWLGDMFDPALTGYWGSTDLGQAMTYCLDILQAHARKIDGIKISLLDAQREIDMRRRLPEGVRMYTGDDFNYPELILGDEQSHSDALLGIFDAIAPAAAAALKALDEGELERYHEILEPTVPLSRHIFQKPTFYYKTGIVFLAYLNGHQTHFRMAAGQESARSIPHLCELFVLADQAGLLQDPELATARMRNVLTLAGVQA
jgi:hypothetical protein